MRHFSPWSIHSNDRCTHRHDHDTKIATLLPTSLAVALDPQGALAAD